jgi:hypothetical protein
MPWGPCSLKANPSNFVAKSVEIIQNFQGILKILPRISVQSISMSGGLVVQW